MCDDNYYWDLDTIGSGDGYYITNGYAVPIKWNKSSRSAKTKYTYAKGTVIDGQDVGGQEITVSDGRTWIEVQTIKQTTNNQNIKATRKQTNAEKWNEIKKGIKNGTINPFFKNL